MSTRIFEGKVEKKRSYFRALEENFNIPLEFSRIFTKVAKPG